MTYYSNGELGDIKWPIHMTSAVIRFVSSDTKQNLNLTKCLDNRNSGLGESEGEACRIVIPFLGECDSLSHDQV